MNQHLETFVNRIAQIERNGTVDEKQIACYKGDFFSPSTGCIAILSAAT
jgi:hypothetical protein